MFSPEYVVGLTHHLRDDFGSRGGASNCPYAFAGRVGHRLPIPTGFGRGRQRRPDRHVIKHVRRVRKQSRLSDSALLLRPGAEDACLSAEHRGGGEQPVGLVGPLSCKSIGEQCVAGWFDVVDAGTRDGRWLPRRRPRRCLPTLRQRPHAMQRLRRFRRKCRLRRAEACQATCGGSPVTVRAMGCVRGNGRQLRCPERLSR